MAQHETSSGRDLNYGGGPTLRDVAIATGVDASTVSKVLKGNGISVRPETRQRILDAVERMGYRPNSVARGLRLRRTGAFGLLLPDITNPVYAAIVAGAVGRVEQIGHVLIIADISAANGDASYRRMVYEKRIDGLLIATSRQHEPTFDQLDRDRVPHVFVNRRVEGGAPSVTVDDEAGAALALAAMWELGHKRLGVVAGPTEVDTARRRLGGFLDEATRRGLKPPHVEREEFTAAGGFAAMTRLLSVKVAPTAVFVSNFVAAVGAMRAAHDAGMRIPDDLSIVAFDDAESASYLVPSLTAVRMPFGQMGAVAVDTLVAIVGGSHPPSSVVSTAPQLVLRESLSPPPNG